MYEIQYPNVIKCHDAPIYMMSEEIVILKYSSCKYPKLPLGGFLQKQGQFFIARLFAERSRGWEDAGKMYGLGWQIRDLFND